MMRQDRQPVRGPKYYDFDTLLRMRKKMSHFL